jgi:hypothetical protein
MKLIGDDRREATDWVQDRFGLTRPTAERTMIAMLKEKVAITTDDGIFLTEAEEEVDIKAKKFSQRIHARKVGRQNKSTFRKLAKQVNNKASGDKIVRTDFSDVADDIESEDDK